MRCFFKRINLRQLIALPLAAVAISATAETLTLVTEPRPPRQMMKDGEVGGIASERVRHLMEDAGVSYSMTMYPFARALYLAQNTANTCIFSIGRNAEREKLFSWIETPIMTIRRVLFARTDSGIRLQSLEEAKRYRIGTYDKDMMDGYLRERGFIVDPAPADDNNIQKLLAKRIDLWVNDEQIGQYEIEQAEKGDAIAPIFTIMTQSVYLACNPNTPPEIIQKLNRAARSVFR